MFWSYNLPKYDPVLYSIKRTLKKNQLLHSISILVEKILKKHFNLFPMNYELTNSGKMNSTSASLSTRYYLAVNHNHSFILLLVTGGKK